MRLSDNWVQQELNLTLARPDGLWHQHNFSVQTRPTLSARGYSTWLRYSLVTRGQVWLDLLELRGA